MEIRNRIKALEYIHTRDLVAHPGNWREHPKAQADALLGVLKEVGIAGALLAYRSERQGGALVVIDGHLRKDAAPQQWPVLVLDVDDAEADYLLATHDPLAAMATADAGALDALLSSVQSGAAAVQAMLAELAEGAGLYQPQDDPQDAEPQVDRAEELRVKWGVEPGQLWRLPSRTPGQEHRLICGDASVPTTVKRLDCGDVTVLLTDPPYSSGGFQESQRKSGSIGNRQNTKIAADQLSTRGYISLMSEVLALVPADVLYMFTDWRMWSWTYDIAERANFPVRNMLVWDKGRMGMGFPWRSTHELILFAKRTPSKMMDGKTGNVLRFDRASNDEHPTEKPVELVQHILENTPDGVVYDPFGGAGTTMIACENLGRACRMVEISPGYVAVALERYATAFGIEPELIT